MGWEVGPQASGGTKSGAGPVLRDGTCALGLEATAAEHTALLGFAPRPVLHLLFTSVLLRCPRTCPPTCPGFLPPGTPT